MSIGAVLIHCDGQKSMAILEAQCVIGVELKTAISPKVVGWGRDTSAFGLDGSGFDELRYVELPFVEKKQCKTEKAAQVYTLMDDKFCVAVTSSK